MGPTMGPIVAKVLDQMSHKNCVANMLTKLNPSLPHDDSCKFNIHLRSLNVGNFGMVEAAGLEVWYRSHVQWPDLPTGLNETLPISSGLISVEHTDGQIAW
jgi:hypothetical protein